MKIKNQGLYLSEFEHDNCGAGFICSLNGERTNSIIGKALNILTCLEHRGAVSSDGRTGDGAGILIEIPHSFFAKKFSRNNHIFGITISKKEIENYKDLIKKINETLNVGSGKENFLFTKILSFLMTFSSNQQNITCI